MMIITHTSPDFDAIGGVWLLKRYGGMADAEVQFVNTGSPDPVVLESANAVVDTGRVFDPGILRFDHHHLPGKLANATCATQMVYNALSDAPAAILPLVTLIYCGDTGKPAANESRAVGIHALLSSKKASRTLDDHGLLAYGFELLDTLATGLIAQDAARKNLAAHTVYRSADGLLVALKNAPQGATFAAHEAGARLVVFADYERNAIGVMRGGEGEDVHCGELVNAVVNDPTAPTDLGSELDTWYRHQAGFFSGRGTAKAPREDAIDIDVRDVAEAIDRAWKRETNGETLARG